MIKCLRSKFGYLRHAVDITYSRVYFLCSKITLHKRLMGRSKRNGVFEHAQNADSSRACAKSHWGSCSPLIPSTVSNNSVSGKRRPWSDCASAQSDQGLRCPHMPGETFSNGAAHVRNIEMIWSALSKSTLKNQNKLYRLSKMYFT